MSAQFPLTWAVSDEVRVMIHPVNSFRLVTAARAPVPSRMWMLIRRPVASVCLVGAFVSFSVTGRLVAPFVVDGIVWWSFLPVLQAIFITLTMIMFARGAMTFARAIDVFFVGQGPWFFWLLTISSIAALAPEVTATKLLSHASPFLLGSALLTLVWLNATTFGFLRGALGLSAARAALATMTYSAALWGTLVCYLFAVDLLPYHR